jgi:signal recognition particle subunit SRP54
MRIARGSGTSVTEVNQLIARFEQAAKMMKTVAKGGMPNIPGTNPALMGGGGYSGGKKKNDKKKKRSKSGNPAKRAVQDSLYGIELNTNAERTSAFRRIEPHERPNAE